MGSTAIGKPPIFIPPQFSTWAPAMIYNIETQFFGMTPTPQNPCSNSGISLGCFTVGQFPGRYSVPPLDKCCVHWSKVFQLGDSYLWPQLPDEGVAKASMCTPQNAIKLSESSWAQSGVTPVGSEVSTAPSTFPIGDLKRSLENESAKSKDQNR